MRHHYTPVHNSIALVSLLHARQMQILKVPIIEKQCLALVECDRAPLLIIIDMYGLWRQRIRPGAIN